MKSTRRGSRKKDAKKPMSPTNYPKASLVGVPREVQLRIIAHLPAIRDMLAVLQTCKKMKILDSDRKFHQTVLLTACIQDDVFLPTFPRDKMTMNELKATARSSHRFSNTLSTHKNGAIKAVSTRTLKLGKHIIGDSDYTELFLVPGGRFLVVFCGKKLSLWDLSNSAPNPKPIAKTSVEIYSRCSREVSKTSDGLGLRVFISEECDNSRDGGGEYRQFCVYEIYPVSQSPEFKKIADFGVFFISEKHKYSFAGDLLLLQDNETVKIVNYVKHTGIYISYEMSDDLLYNTFIDKHTFCTVALDGVYIWKIPKLLKGYYNEPQRYNGSEDEQDQAPLKYITHRPKKFIGIDVDPGGDPGAGEMPDSNFIRLSSWYSNLDSNRMLTFELIHPLKRHEKIYMRGQRFGIDLGRKTVDLEQKIYVDKGFLLDTPQTRLFGASRMAALDYPCSKALPPPAEEPSKEEEEEEGESDDEYSDDEYDNDDEGDNSGKNPDESNEESSARVGICVSRKIDKSRKPKQGWERYILSDIDEEAALDPKALCALSGRVYSADTESGVLTVYDYI